MSEFDIKASGWDKSMMHRERAETVADAIRMQIPLSREMKAMEFGAGTGLLSFNLRNQLGQITMVDSSGGMVEVLLEKAGQADASNMTVMKADLEKEDYTGEKFGLIYTLMVLHHVNDVNKILGKFSEMLLPGGYLAIADLYSEDGSFHGEGFKGHMGFDPDKLASLLELNGFTGITHRKVYEIEKMTTENGVKKFDVFLMTGVRK